MATNTTQPKPTILIIAGGQNSRFFPLNSSTHKGFLTLLGEPLIVRGLKDAVKHGFKDIVLVVSQKDYELGKIEALLKEHRVDINLTLILQEKAKGQGNAVLSAQPYLGKHFILSSPYYTNMGEIADLLWKNKFKTNADCVFLASESKNPELEGILELEGEKVVGIVEKPSKESAPSNIRVRSIYLLDQGFLEVLSQTKQEENSLETAIDHHCKVAHYSYALTKLPLPTLKYAWHLFDFAEYLMQGMKTKMSTKANLSKTAVIDLTNGPVVIEAGATIGDFTYIQGPCYIGKNVFIGQNCVIRGGCLLEENSVVGANTEVVRSIIFPKTSIHFGYIADSILGEGSKIGAGLITANKRLDRKNIVQSIKNKAVDSGRNNFGIITGENAALGIRVSTMPGVLIGARAKVLPGKILYKSVNHDEEVK